VKFGPFKQSERSGKLIVSNISEEKRENGVPSTEPETSSSSSKQNSENGNHDRQIMSFQTVMCVEMPNLLLLPPILRDLIWISWILDFRSHSLPV
jgi:hypothetical protein